MTSITITPVASRVQRLAYFIELTKPRILVMILLTVMMSFVAVGSGASLLILVHACIGTSLVAASASVLNQWLERDRDAIMMRTSKRPLPAGRVASSQAAWMGWVLIVVGSLYLCVFVNFSTALLGLLTWCLYVWIYTPLKLKSWTNTLIGTIPGALPVWMGWTAAEGSLLDPNAWVLLGILIAWQLPHFMAIAWMYQQQYEAAGYKMITVTDKSGLGASLHAMLGALSLIVLTTLAIPPSSFTTTLLCIMCVAVSLWQAWIVWRFTRKPDTNRARKMLLASFVHLPITMLLISISFLCR